MLFVIVSHYTGYREDDVLVFVGIAYCCELPFTIAAIEFAHDERTLSCTFCFRCYVVLGENLFWGTLRLSFKHADRGVRYAREIAAILIVVIDVQEKHYLLHLTAHTRQVDRYNLIVQAVVAILVAREIVTRMVQGTIDGVKFTIRQAKFWVASTELIEWRPDVINRFTFCVKHQATQVQVNIYGSSAFLVGRYTYLSGFDSLVLHAK